MMPLRLPGRPVRMRSTAATHQPDGKTLRLPALAVARVQESAHQRWKGILTTRDPRGDMSYGFGWKIVKLAVRATGR